MASTATEHSPPNPQTDANDEVALQTLFQKLLDTWASVDAEAYANLFTEDADYVAFDGVNQKGREAIINSHRPLFEKWLKGSRLTGEITSLRFLSPAVALLYVSGGTVLNGKTAPEAERSSIQSLVAVRRDGVWKFTSFHNTRIRPFGGLKGVLLWQVTDKLWRLFGRERPLPLAPTPQPSSQAASGQRRDQAV